MQCQHRGVNSRIVALAPQIRLFVATKSSLQIFLAVRRIIRFRPEILVGPPQNAERLFVVVPFGPQSGQDGAGPQRRSAAGQSQGHVSPQRNIRGPAAQAVLKHIVGQQQLAQLEAPLAEAR